MRNFPFVFIGVFLWLKKNRYARQDSLKLKDDIQMTECHLIFIVQIMLDTGG
jgi:hypothetical protein